VSSRVTGDIDLAVAVLAEGGVIALPTETVYGLAADATNAAAVRRVFAIKGRPRDHPLIVHIADPDDLERWGAEASPAARRLASLAWPGPLSLIVWRGAAIASEVTGGLPTMAVRCPAHPMAREVIRRLGRPVAAPSANRFGRVSPTTAQHVADDLGDDVDVILDGGPCDIGVESTVVDCTTDPVQLLRPGSLSATDIEGLLATSVAEASGPIRAPGMLEVHYAPACRVFVAEDDADVDLISGQLAAAALSVDVLDLRRDAVAAARGLYGWLRDADRRGVTHLIVIPPAAAGLGIAVRDRLTRAAAGRSAH